MSAAPLSDRSPQRFEKPFEQFKAMLLAPRVRADITLDAYLALEQDQRKGYKDGPAFLPATFGQQQNATVVYQYRAGKSRRPKSSAE